MAKHESLIYEAMYTAHLHQKHKIWHDGKVKLDSHSRKVILMDDDGRLLGESWLKEEAQPGATLTIGQSLVEFGELLQRKPEDRVEPSLPGSRPRASPIRTPLRPKAAGTADSSLSRIIEAAGAGQYRPGHSRGFGPSTQGKSVSNYTAANEPCAQISSFNFVSRPTEPIQLTDTGIHSGIPQTKQSTGPKAIKEPLVPQPVTRPQTFSPTGSSSSRKEQSSPTAVQGPMSLADVYGSTEEGMPEYTDQPDTGPWSSEAYILFKWRPPGES